MTVLRLRCKAQNYAWGKVGDNSMVARLMVNENPDFNIVAQTPYAELWMGTHPSGPSVVTDDEFKGQTLSEWLSHHQGASDLPYLLKVLSVNKALSIQAHPNKAHAELLFRDLPDKYPDANHKPEMAIALTPFRALCGFRPLQEIQDFIRDVPEFGEALGSCESDALLNAGQDASGALKRCFTALMEGTNHQALLERLQQRIRNSTESQLDPETRDLFLQLCEQFPGDVGCFGTFFFNLLCLQPGQAIFLAANEPHAYLSGDCVECMACSDNVVRAGLTPKWKDVSTLCEMLTYKMKSKEDNLFQPSHDPNDPYMTHYLPPVKDFALTKIQVPAGVSDYRPRPLPGGSLILCTEGTGSLSHDSKSGVLSAGTVLFLSPATQISINVDAPVQLFQAYSQ